MALTKLDKPAGAWTYEDLFALPDDGTRYEIIEGELYEMPAPNLDHATVMANLITMVIPLVTGLGGRWYTAPLDVFFAGADPVQPDFLAMFPGWVGTLEKRGPQGAPDFVVEVLSPSNRVHDTLTKRALYARAGVREYWIIDPMARTLEIQAFDNDAAHGATLTGGDDVPVSPLLGPLPFPTSALFAGLDN